MQGATFLLPHTCLLSPGAPREAGPQPQSRCCHDKKGHFKDGHQKPGPRARGSWTLSVCLSRSVSVCLSLLPRLPSPPPTSRENRAQG